MLVVPRGLIASSNFKWIRLLVTILIILGQAISYNSNYFGSGCWLLFTLFWIRLLVTVPVILDQVVGYCSHYFAKTNNP
jgi:uncharacterized membrane protein